MHITFKPDKRRFEAVDWPREHNDPLKQAGFRFDWDGHLWMTQNLDSLCKLADYGDASVKSYLQRPICLGLNTKTHRFYAWFAYCPELVQCVKLYGLKWDADMKMWSTTDEYAIRRLLQDFRVQATTEVMEHLSSREDQIALSQAAQPVTALQVPAPAGLSYLPYQLVGIEYAHHNESTLLADEMGLGKTIQAIGFLNLETSLSSVLIIAPLTVKLNWKRELQRWLTRNLTVGMATAKKWPDTDIIILHPEIVVKWQRELHSKVWDLAILDEAHLFKSYSAQRTVVLFGGKGQPSKLRAHRKLALTGTPIPNRPAEIYPILRWLAPVEWGDLRNFIHRYCDGEAHSTRYGWHTRGASHLDELQSRLRSTVMIRRLKADVLTDLPSKIRQVIAVELDALDANTQRVFRHESTRVSTLRQAVALAEAHVQSLQQCGGVAYKLAVDELRQTHLSQINEIARLRHETALAKVPLVIEQVSAMLDNSEDKVVVWAHHQDVIQALREGLSSFGTVSIVGGDSVNARQQAVDEFQEGAARVIIGSILAAGVGITLTRASRVVFAELDWVPGNISQCEDRCHRIGQSDTVHCLHIVVNGSVDAMLAEAIVTKQEVITQALDGHDAQEADMLKMLETLYRCDDPEVEEATVEAVGQTMS